MTHSRPPMLAEADQADIQYLHHIAHRMGWEEIKTDCVDAMRRTVEQ